MIKHPTDPTRVIGVIKEWEEWEPEVISKDNWGTIISYDSKTKYGFITPS